MTAATTGFFLFLRFFLGLVSATAATRTVPAGTTRFTALTLQIGTDHDSDDDRRRADSDKDIDNHFVFS